MYDVKQFKNALYLVVLVGFTGFAVASESPGAWLVATTLTLANAWLVARGRFKPMPRVVFSVVGLVAFTYAFGQVVQRISPILAVGQFLVVLQVVKLWEQKANRDYAQLLVLSLLLMVAAAISTVSLVFGLLFVTYLFLSLYCCLLFHLKVETDEARRALAVPGDEAAAGEASAADQRSLGKSMRRLTGLVAGYGLVSAVAVFLFCPRFGASMFGQYLFKPRASLTGFSEQVGFQNVARITANNDLVATMKLSKDGQPTALAGPLLLRGVTYDYYTGGDEKQPYQWTHYPDAEPRPMYSPESYPEWWMVDDGADVQRPQRAKGQVIRPPPDASVYRQDFDLNPIGSAALFAMAGATGARVDDGLPASRRPRLLYAAVDGTVRATVVPSAGLRYTVDSTGRIPDGVTVPHERSRIDGQIAAFARRADVTGDLPARRDAELAARPRDRVTGRRPTTGPTAVDGEIAGRLESYLRRNFRYTLDLTNVERIRDRDPMVAFLYDFKAGHCEYFAGAMTLLCQSLGLDARMAVGFKCDEYNRFGHFYSVRQSQAHTWVEVRTTGGWQSFDPTAGTDEARPVASTWQKAKQFFDFLEYTWQSSVILYNTDSRESLMSNVDMKMTNTVIGGTTLVSKVTGAVQAVGDWLATRIVGPLVGLLVLGLMSAVGYFTFERWRVRRRARRIGLGDLAPARQAELVRQLAFYDDLIQLLDRHAIRRPAHLTPREFGESLTYLPSAPYRTVRRLTAAYYRIRYGGTRLDDAQVRRLSDVVARLGIEMMSAE